MDRGLKDTKGKKPEGEMRIGSRPPEQLCIQIKKHAERAAKTINGHKDLDKKTKKNFQAFITDIVEQANKDLSKARGSAVGRSTQMQEERTQALHRIQGRALQIEKY